LTLLLAGCLAFLCVRRYVRVPADPTRRAVYPVQSPVRPASTREPERLVYPYSVLIGGAWSRTELTNRLAADPVASAHYRGFKVAAARTEQLSASQRLYVSYRVKDTVYWSRAPVYVPAGETILTDGENMARARCGNRLSTKALSPVGPDVDLDDPPEVDVTGLAHLAGMPDLSASFPLLAPDLVPPLISEGHEAEAAIAALPPKPAIEVAPASVILYRSLHYWGLGGIIIWIPIGSRDTYLSNLSPPGAPPPGFVELPSLSSAFYQTPVLSRLPLWSEIGNQFYPVPLTSSGLPPVPFVLPPPNFGGTPFTLGKIDLNTPPGGPSGNPPPGSVPPGKGGENPTPPGGPPGGPPRTPPPGGDDPPTTPPIPLLPTPVVVPEPGTMLLILSAVGVGIVIRRVRR
jgi:hypothetical protein